MPPSTIIGNPLSIPLAVNLEDEAEVESDLTKLISDNAKDIDNGAKKEIIAPSNNYLRKYGTLRKMLHFGEKSTDNFAVYLLLFED